MQVAVTGANGFIGSWLTVALLEEGFGVTALVRAGSDHSLLRELMIGRLGDSLEHPRLRFQETDITDSGSVRGALEAATAGGKLDACFHLAALMTANRSEREALFRVNVEGTRKVVQACAALGVGKLVHVSSAVAIGALPSEGPPLTEDSRGYDRAERLSNFRSKKLSEEIVLEACARRELDGVVVNPSLVYGGGDARKSVRKGNVQAARGELKATLRGGVNVVAVQDVVAGILAAWRKGRTGERYILSGENMQLRDLLFAISDAAGAMRPKNEVPTWFLRVLGLIGDLLRLDGPLSSENAFMATLYHWYDHSKATRELDFHPRPARQAIESSVQWMRAHGYLDR